MLSPFFPPKSPNSPTYPSAVVLTSSHQVVPEEGDTKPQGEHHQVRGDAREERGKPRGLRAEIEKGSHGQHPVGVESHQVVLPGVQFRRLHQLGTGMGHGLVPSPWGWSIGYGEQAAGLLGGSLAPTVPSAGKGQLKNSIFFFPTMYFIACFHIFPHPVAQNDCSSGTVL